MERSVFQSVFIIISAIFLVIVIVLFFTGQWIYKQLIIDNSRLRLFFNWFGRQQPRIILLFLITLLMCILYSTIVYSPLQSWYAAATPATAAEPIFWVTLAMTGVAFMLTQILLFLFIYRFRSAENRKALFIDNNHKLEFFWTAIVSVCFLGLAVWSQILWRNSLPAAESTLNIEVVGQQFNWKVRYPGADGILGKSSFRLITAENPLGIDPSDSSSLDDFIPIQMHVPKGRKVTLLLRSKDVIHSFYIPMFRTKMDAVPGMYTRMQFTPLYTTDEMRRKRNDPSFNYEIACAELCGSFHFAMKMILVVDSPESFDRWYSRQDEWMEARHEKNNEMLNLQNEASGK